MLLTSVPPDLHPIYLKELLFFDIDLKVLTHLEEISEQHLLSLLSQCLESHFLNSHQVLLAVEIVNFSYAFLFELRYINDFYFFNSRWWTLSFLIILVRSSLIKTIFMVLIITVFIMIFFFMMHLRCLLMVVFHKS